MAGEGEGEGEGNRFSLRVGSKSIPVINRLSAFCSYNLTIPPFSEARVIFAMAYPCFAFQTPTPQLPTPVHQPAWAAWERGRGGVPLKFVSLLLVLTVSWVSEAA